jgi:hypothetical protein
MANEIVISLAVTVTNGYFKDQFAPGQVLVDQAAVGMGGSVQLIGTSEEVVDFGDVVTPGYMTLRNLDSYDYIEYGPSTGGTSGTMVPFGVLRPGEVALIRLAADVVMMAQAITGDTTPATAALFDVRVSES